MDTELEEDGVMKRARLSAMVTDLQHRLQQREMELRETRYELAQLQSLANTRQDYMHDTWTNEKMSLRCEVDRLQKSNDFLSRENMNERSFAHSHAEKILRLIVGIEKHTLNFRHSCNSPTLLELITKIRQAAGDLKSRYNSEESKGRWEVGSSLKDYGIDSSYQSMEAKKFDNERIGATNNNDALDNVYLDICKKLEEENVRSQQTILELQGELQDAQREATANKVIPHYRLAIIRYRSSSVLLLLFI
jgi:hypothetical protein